MNLYIFLEIHLFWKDLCPSVQNGMYGDLCMVFVKAISSMTDGKVLIPARGAFLVDLDMKNQWINKES